MVFPLAKSAFTSIEPKSQSGSTRTSFPASSSARALFSLDAAIPSPATALAVAPSLMVTARDRTAEAGAASYCACAGANRVTVQRDRLEDATRGCAAATVRSPIMPNPASG
jgi:hypothetical protein